MRLTLDAESTCLEPCGYSLVHLEELFGTVDGAVVLSVGHFPRGEVPDAVVEADFGQLVVVLEVELEGLDLLAVGDGRGVSPLSRHLKTGRKRGGKRGKSGKSGSQSPHEKDEHDLGSIGRILKRRICSFYRKVLLRCQFWSLFRNPLQEKDILFVYKTRIFMFKFEPNPKSSKKIKHENYFHILLSIF